MKRFSILILLIGFCEAGYPLENYSARVNALMSAASGEDLEFRLRTLSDEERAIRYCAAELKGERVPIHCLRLIQKGVLPPKGEDQANWRAMLSRLCQRAIDQIDDVREIRTLLPDLISDRDCVLAAKRRKQRLEYIHPESLTEIY